jgi:hypothetical protein
LLLSACASETPVAPPKMPHVSAPDPVVIAAVKAERDASTRAYVFCQLRAAKHLDDHKSDAATIAQAVLAECATEFQQDVEIYSRGLGLDGEKTVAAALQSAALGAAIKIVLINRQPATSR